MDLGKLVKKKTFLGLAHLLKNNSYKLVVGELPLFKGLFVTFILLIDLFA
jgi:hypothetical protein